jgi:glucokinase
LVQYYIAVDLGATKTRIALCTPSSIIDKQVYSTPKEGDENTIADFIASAIINKWRSLLGDVKGIGVATIGPLDIRRGVVVNSPNINIKRVELLRPLHERFQVPVYVANDCVAAAWGERHYGDAVGVENFVYITISTGVGGGVIVDGELLIGKMGNAHEVGHIVVDYNSDLKCGCGGRGHWEAFAGGNNIPRVASYFLEKGLFRGESELADLVSRGVKLEAKDIFSYYVRGDPLATMVVEAFIKATGAGLASVINAYDPEMITIGGGVFLNNVDLVFEPILKIVRDNVVTEMPIIKPTRLGDDVGLYGALALATNPPPKLKRIQKL